MSEGHQQVDGQFKALSFSHGANGNFARIDLLAIFCRNVMAALVGNEALFTPRSRHQQPAFLKHFANAGNTLRQVISSVSFRQT